MPTVSIELKDGSQKNFELRGEKSLFDELQACGLTLPHGCLSGSCSACKVYVLSGEANLTSPDPIEANTLEWLQKNPTTHPLRLSCRAKVSGADLSIKVF